MRFPVCVFILILTLAGCGGSGSPESESLTTKYHKALKDTNRESRCRQLIKVAMDQWKAGDSSGFSMSLGSAVKAADEISDPSGQASVLCGIAEAQAKGDQKREAEKLLKQAVKTAEKISDALGKLPALVRIAEVYGQSLKDVDTAKEQLAECEKLAATLEDPVVQANSALSIALGYQRASSVADAERTIAAALSAARALEDIRKRADVLAAAGETLTKMQLADQAKTAFDDAEQAAGQVEDANSRGHALLNLAKKKAAAGQKADAQKLLVTAADAAKKVTDKSMRNSLEEDVETASRKL